MIVHVLPQSDWLVTPVSVLKLPLTFFHFLQSTIERERDEYSSLLQLLDSSLVGGRSFEAKFQRVNSTFETANLYGSILRSLQSEPGEITHASSFTNSADTQLDLVVRKPGDHHVESTSAWIQTSQDHLSPDTSPSCPWHIHFKSNCSSTATNCLCTFCTHSVCFHLWPATERNHCEKAVIWPALSVV